MRTVLAALVVLAGCVTVRSATSPSADLARYRTFAWYTPATARGAALERSPAGELVRERIARGLAARGIRESPDRPDFFVAYDAELRPRLDVEDWGYPTVFWGAPPGPVTIDEYTQRTLAIDFIDARTGRIFWRGTATAVAEHPENPNPRELAKAVDKVMKRYPAEVASR